MGALLKPGKRCALIRIVKRVARWRYAADISATRAIQRLRGEKPCRNYPPNLLDAPAPRFLEGCVRYALARNADRVRTSLERLDLPPEKMAVLERQFFVREANPSNPPYSSSTSTSMTGGDE